MRYLKSRLQVIYIPPILFYIDLENGTRKSRIAFHLHTWQVYVCWVYPPLLFFSTIAIAWSVGGSYPWAAGFEEASQWTVLVIWPWKKGRCKQWICYCSMGIRWNTMGVLYGIFHGIYLTPTWCGIWVCAKRMELSPIDGNDNGQNASFKYPILEYPIKQT